jgi:hypothetical protein
MDDWIDGPFNPDRESSYEDYFRRYSRSLRSADKSTRDAVSALKRALQGVRFRAQFLIDLDGRTGRRDLRQPDPELKIGSSSFRVPRDTLDDDVRAVIEEGERKGLSPTEVAGLLSVRVMNASRSR